MAICSSSCILVHCWCRVCRYSRSTDHTCTMYLFLMKCLHIFMYSLFKGGGERRIWSPVYHGKALGRVHLSFNYTVWTPLYFFLSFNNREKRREFFIRVNDFDLNSKRVRNHRGQNWSFPILAQVKLCWNNGGGSESHPRNWLWTLRIILNNK